MTELPETRYARTAGGDHIAYQVVGDAPLDLLYVCEGASHLEMAWEIPAYARVFRRLASFSRLIRFDMRGTGLSDSFGRTEQPSLERLSEDMVAVADAAGADRPAVVANATGGLHAMFFAAAQPERVSHLVLNGCFARQARAEEYPFGVPRQVLEKAVDGLIPEMAENGQAIGLRYLAPNAARDDPKFVKEYMRYARSAGGPAAQRAMAELAVFSDMRPVLPAIQAPTLVVYRSGDRWVGRPYASFLAEHITDAKLVEVPGDDNLLYVGNSEAVVDEIEEFLTGARHVPVTDRVLATVLFTDIVASTERAAEMGDRSWREVLDAHDQATRRQLERFRGREINTSGDGFVATFDGPGRAIECASAIRDALLAIGIEIRAGLHTGEIELRGDDIGGIAVHIAARVASLAGPGDVVVSDSIPKLVAGSGIEFEDRGEQQLKGVPGTWRLYSVER